MLSLALIMALGLTGIGYSAWLDMVNINGTVEVGSWGVGLTNAFGTTDNTSLSVGPSNVLNITLTQTSAGTTYSGVFDVSDNGTVPIKIQSILPVTPPSGIASITVGGVGVGTVIEPGAPIGATVDIVVSTDGSYLIPITFVAVNWNQ